MIDFEPILTSDIVFVGDSLTESFDLWKHFDRKDLRNRGMSGNTTDHVIYRMEEISKAKPAEIFLMIGINDLFTGQSTMNIYENIKTIIERFIQNTPNTTLNIQSILPVNVAKLFEEESINLQIYELNNRIEAYCQLNENLVFINLHTEFLDMNGEMDNRYTFDGVHLSESGYSLWAGLVKKYLQK